MRIRLDSQSTTDGEGVEHWNYDLNDTWRLHVCARPAAVSEPQHRYMLELMRGSECVTRYFRRTKPEAAKLATEISETKP